MKEPLLFPHRGKYGPSSGPILFPGDLRRFLIALNPRLRIHGPIKENRAMFIASVAHWDEHYDERRHTPERRMGHWRECCRVPVQAIPERSIHDSKGHILARGWREVLSILGGQGYIKIPSRYGGRYGILKYGNPVTIIDA